MNLQHSGFHSFFKIYFLSDALIAKCIDLNIKYLSSPLEKKLQLINPAQALLVRGIFLLGL